MGTPGPATTFFATTPGGTLSSYVGAWLGARGSARILPSHQDVQRCAPRGGPTFLTYGGET
jgi:hypothetical protein